VKDTITVDCRCAHDLSLNTASSWAVVDWHLVDRQHSLRGQRLATGKWGGKKEDFPPKGA